MRLKIISDGTARGTKVVNSATGEEITGIRAIMWHIEPGENAKATIILDAIGVEVEVEGEATAKTQELKQHISSGT